MPMSSQPLKCPNRSRNVSLNATSMYVGPATQKSKKMADMAAFNKVWFIQYAALQITETNLLNYRRNIRNNSTFMHATFFFTAVSIDGKQRYLCSICSIVLKKQKTIANHSTALKKHASSEAHTLCSEVYSAHRQSLNTLVITGKKHKLIFSDFDKKLATMRVEND